MQSICEAWINETTCLTIITVLTPEVLLVATRMVGISNCVLDVCVDMAADKYNSIAYALL